MLSSKTTKINTIIHKRIRERMTFPGIFVATAGIVITVFL